jgi:hypothetical protein
MSEIPLALNYSEDDKNLISTALSLIWKKNDKKVELCQFDNDKVKLSLKNNEGHVYFELQDKIFENEVTN